MAMAGLLTALKGTNLYHRLEREGRLLHESTGNNTDIALNFVPQLPRDQLVAEYRRVVSTLYDPTLKNYFERCLTMLNHLKFKDHGVRRIGKREVMACVKSIQRQLFSKQGPAYFRFLAKVLKEYPKLFPKAIELAIHGYHFEKVTSNTIATHDFKQYLKKEFNTFKETVSGFAKSQSDHIGEIGVQAQEIFARARAAYEDIDEDFRYSVHDALDDFRKTVFKQYLEAEFDAFKETVSQFAKAQGEHIVEVGIYIQSLLLRAQAAYESTDKEFRHSLQDAFQEFQRLVECHKSGFLTEN